MQITARGTLTECQAKRGSSSPAVLWLKFRLPLDGLKDVEIAKLSRFVNGDPVGVAVDLGPFVAERTGASGNGRQATIAEAAPVEAKRRPERPTPLPEEACASCGYRIGEDPDRRFYTPLAGGPRAMHGACADAAERDRGGETERGARGVALPGATEGATLVVDGPAVVVGPETETVRAPAAEEDRTVPAVPADAPDGWAFTDEPAPAGDPEAAAALGEVLAEAAAEATTLPPHLAKIADAAEAEQAAAFDELGRSPAERRRRRSRAAEVRG